MIHHIGHDRHGRYFASESAEERDFFRRFLKGLGYITEVDGHTVVAKDNPEQSIKKYLTNLAKAVQNLNQNQEWKQ